MDPVLFNIISRALESIPEEMGVNLLKAAYSSIVREAKDMSAALFDRTGHVVAQAEHTPILLSAVASALEGVLEKHPLETWRPGDCAITNDPYHGGQHLNDVAVYTPIFFGSQLVAIAGCIAHHLDIGGITAGIVSGATEVFHDGFIFPRVKFPLQQGKLDPILQAMIRGNLRVPGETIGDLHAQVVADRTAEGRLVELIHKFGLPDVLQAMEERQNYSERMTRAQLEGFPDGEYHGEALVDDDGEGNGPFAVRVAVTIRGSDVLVDFGGSDGQARGMINCPFASTLAGAYTAIRHVVTTAVDIPPNAGCNRPVRVVAPSGCLVNPLPPASVHARYITAYRCYEAVMAALTAVVPDRVSAVGFNSTACQALSRSCGDEYLIFCETAAGGWGAGPRSDGADALPLPLSNCSNVPAEWLEHQFPYLRLLRYEMRADSCGHGRQRGGLGELREFEILEDDVAFAAMCDRFVYSAGGVFGGTEGGLGAYRVLRDGQVIELASKCTYTLRRGDIVQIVTGGGGGYGPPRERPRDLVERDLRGGYISAQTAREVYGLDVPAGGPGGLQPSGVSA
jgi:N-methylhydantoinase B